MTIYGNIVEISISYGSVVGNDGNKYSVIPSDQFK